MEPKTCTNCRVPKLLPDFQVRNNKPISQCRLCVNAQKSGNRRKKKAEVRQHQIEAGEIILPTDSLNNQICNICRREKPKTEFRPYRCKCVDCERADGRSYRQSGYGQDKSAQWVEENRERMTELQALWYQENKERRNEEYNRRYHSDPVFKFQQLCRRRIGMAFSDQDLRKSNNTIEYLNCSVPWLIQWFTYCFSSEMTLENHGSYWHMDHVIPVNLFDLTDPVQVYFCFSWFNLSPLPGSENMSKQDTINTRQLTQHIQKLMDFLCLWKVQPPQDYFDICARHLIIAGSPLELYLPLGQ